MGRVTLKQIALDIGLSTFAVSRALAGKDGVSTQTRALVGEAATRLGYIHPAAATREIGLVFYDLDHLNTELHMQIQNGVQREAHRLQRPVRVHWAHDFERIAELARASEGLLLVGPYDRATIAQLKATQAPMVRLGWIEPLEQADQVVTTDREGGQAVIGYLAGLGHREIAYVMGSASYRGRRERFHGAREMAEQIPGLALHKMEFEEHGGFAGALCDLQRRQIHPTAYFCANDGLALTVVSQLLGSGIRIPEDASVVGFGDFAAATQISPALTTVRVEGGEIGAVALRLLLERIAQGRDATAPARRIMIASRIIERRSTGPSPALHEAGHMRVDPPAREASRIRS